MNRIAHMLPATEAGTIRLGDFTVNRMGYGGMRITGPGAWGNPQNVDLCKQVIKRAVELGVTFIDTADTYGPGVSEMLIKQTLAPYGRVVVGTKGGQVHAAADEWQLNITPEHLRKACNASRKRLGVPQIGLYQLHMPDPDVPFENSLRALIELQAEGKITHIGLCDATLEQLQAALKLAPIVSVQNHYNLWNRAESEAVLEFCEAHKIVFIPYFPTGGGLVKLDQPQLQQVAQKYDATTHQVALAWLLARSPQILVAPGTASIEHLEANIAASGLKLDAPDMKLLGQVAG